MSSQTEHCNCQPLPKSKPSAFRSRCCPSTSPPSVFITEFLRRTQSITRSISGQTHEAWSSTSSSIASRIYLGTMINDLLAITVKKVFSGAHKTKNTISRKICTRRSIVDIKFPKFSTNFKKKPEKSCTPNAYSCAQNRSHSL